MVLKKKKLAILCSAAAIGITITFHNELLADRKNSETKKAESTEEQISVEDVQRFSNALNQIKSFYVTPVKDKVLFENAIRGMLTGLDPHSEYLDEKEYKELQEITSGEFAGLGIEVTMEEGVIKVIAPLDEAPAQKAGIKPGDYIVRLDQSPIQGLTLRDAVNKMRGPKGSTINLTVLRKGETKPLQFTLTREIVQVKSVKSRLLDKYYGYIKISHFQSMTSHDLIAAVSDLKKQTNGQLKGIVLDLRNNPGGLLEEAIQTSDAFLGTDDLKNEPLIVYTKGRVAGSKFAAYATPPDILNHEPIVVLINEGSASASEIVAGALKDNKRAILIGTRTFGKGSVQTVLPLDDKSAIKLTTALYYTPSGTSIQAKGIEPDIKVDELKISKKPENANFEDFSEAELSGHIDNPNDPRQQTTTTKDKQASQRAQSAGTTKSNNEELQQLITTNKKVNADENLAETDYQLSEALNVLKGLVLTQEEHK